MFFGRCPSKPICLIHFDTHAILCAEVHIGPDAQYTRAGSGNSPRGKLIQSRRVGLEGWRRAPGIVHCSAEEGLRTRTSVQSVDMRYLSQTVRYSDDMPQTVLTAKEIEKYKHTWVSRDDLLVPC